MFTFAARLAPRIRGVVAGLPRRAISTATVHPAVADVRQLALPIAFLSVQGWEGDEGMESWNKWATLFAKAGYSSLLLSIDPTTAKDTSSSQALLSSLETELTTLLASSGGSPFPPLLLASGPSTLLAETYVSSHPLSALLLHSRTDPALAHSEFPLIFPTPLDEFTYEPNFAIAVMETEEEKLGGRLLDEFAEEEDGEVQGLVGGKDKEGWKVVEEWMDEHGL